ncbi:galactokinase [Rubrivivax gelatinosus]|uniref:Galactokinase n=1 Tax=Rubrivivax gelatinosus TaxID=28068 RepID=A0ABS1DU03_RUBGE|nr:galactokinase [Rubrivivax gelatinosus]MBK1616233.1 galactokinase [Rubrivivax gelatinosus]MBK1713095.1 galactokinase [Rubrivivax gelatinosus]
MNAAELEAFTHDRFLAEFGVPAEAVASAPGRVNLLGEHTDYNEGFVLPVAIPQRTAVALRPSVERDFALHSDAHGRTVRFVLGRAPDEDFARYVYGCLMQAQGAGVVLPAALAILVHSEVPIGIGLSSSAALEVATLRALRTLTGAALDDVEIARLGQRAEIEYAGVNCGILDQMASSLAGEDRALLLDVRSGERHLVGLPPGSALLVLDSGVVRTLAASGYNIRRAECEAAAHALGLASLRDLDDATRAAALPPPLPRRVRHVVSENARVIQAAATHDPRVFGRLMNASHASQRDDYEVSTPEVDALVARLQAHPDVFGARLTGGGFGGACVALVRTGCEARVAADAGRGARALVPAFDAPAASG